VNSALVLTQATLEAQAQDLGARIRTYEEAGHPIARATYQLYLAYEARRVTDNGIQGFKNWFSQLTGVPEGSVWYHVQVGTALAAHLTEPEPAADSGPDDATPDTPLASPVPAGPVAAPTARDLRAAGSALLAGAPVSEVKQAVRSGTIRDYASAQQSGGTVSIRLALPAKTVWDEQTRRWMGLTKLPFLEAQVLMVTAIQYVNDDDVRAIARAGEITQGDPI
jgi:hypothetical protein